MLIDTDLKLIEKRILFILKTNLEDIDNYYGYNIYNIKLEYQTIFGSTITESTNFRIFINRIIRKNDVPYTMINETSPRVIRKNCDNKPELVFIRSNFQDDDNNKRIIVFKDEYSKEQANYKFNYTNKLTHKWEEFLIETILRNVQVYYPDHYLVKSAHISLSTVLKTLYEIEEELNSNNHIEQISNLNNYLKSEKAFETYLTELISINPSLPVYFRTEYLKNNVKKVLRLDKEKLRRDFCVRSSDHFSPSEIERMLCFLFKKLFKGKDSNYEFFLNILHSEFKTEFGITNQFDIMNDDFFNDIFKRNPELKLKCVHSDIAKNLECKKILKIISVTNQASDVQPFMINEEKSDKKRVHEENDEGEEKDEDDESSLEKDSKKTKVVFDSNETIQENKMEEEKQQQQEDDDFPTSLDFIDDGPVNETN
jgi:hypothetical protein